MWSEDEIAEYRTVMRTNSYLQATYMMAEIPPNNPEERARFLDEDVLKLTMTDHDLIMRISHDKGRVAGLIRLEDMFISHYPNNAVEFSSLCRKLIPKPE
jgi:hypothetical protein